MRLLLLLVGFLAGAQTGHCREESPGLLVSVQESQNWLMTLPWPSPSPRTIGVGGGTWRSMESLRAARAAASAAMFKAGGVMVQFKRTSIHSGRGSPLELETQLILYGHDAEPLDGCEATMWEAGYNLTWCIGSLEPGERNPNGSSPSWPPLPAGWLQTDAPNRPGWTESLPEVPGWRLGVGVAGRTVKPSAQLPLAEQRGLQAIAEQVEVRLHSITVQGRQEKATSHSIASAAVFLEGTRTVSVWRSVDGSLYVLVAARISNQIPSSP